MARPSLATWGDPMRTGMTGKNYAIEFYRILATIVICMHHFYGFPLQYSNLAVCVEFFFILSGYFLMVSFDRERNHGAVAYGKKRFLRLYPEFLLAYLALLAWIVVIQRTRPDPVVVIPELLFLKSAGVFNEGYNYPDWYVCILFWGELIIYNCLTYNRRLFTRVVAPLLVLFGYAWLFGSDKGIGTLEIWDSFYPLLRALCGLSLGVLVYEVQRSGCMKDMKLWQGTVIEVLSLLVIVYSLIRDRNLWALAIVGFIFLCIVTVQRKGWLSSVLLDRAVFGTLSKASYGMYLNQTLMITFTWRLVGGNTGWKAWTVYFAGLIVAAVVIHYVADWLMKRIRQGKLI